MADFRIDRKEKITDAIGIDGRQATLLKESSTQEEDKFSLHGRFMVPRIIIHSNNINCKGDSINPAKLLSSVVSC